MLITAQLVKGSAIVQQREVTNPIKGSVEGPAERSKTNQRKKSHGALPGVIYENPA